MAARKKRGRQRSRKNSRGGKEKDAPRLKYRIKSMEELRSSEPRSRAPAARRLFAGDMWAMLNFGTVGERANAFVARGRLRYEGFVESLLLHDHIVIPTHDYMSLMVLIHQFGPDLVERMLDEGALSFVRVQGALAYMGNGVGLEAFTVSRERGERPIEIFGSNEEALDPALRQMRTQDRHSLRALVLRRTQVVPMKDIVRTIAQESYEDVLKSQELRALFSVRNEDLKRLSGIAPNQMRVYGGRDSNPPKDEVDLLLVLASSNLELRLARISQCFDASTESPIGPVLKAKRGRFERGELKLSKFGELREEADIPDVGAGVLDGRVSLADVMAIRNSKDGEAFRRWFHEKCGTPSADVGTAYKELLKSGQLSQSLGVKVLRFLITTGLGFVPSVGGPLGIAASAVDAFLIGDLGGGGNPRIFLRDLEKALKVPRRSA